LIKDLSDWRRQLKIFSTVLSSAILFSTTLIGNEDFLSQTKKDTINYSYEKAIEDSSKLKEDWINPITYKYIYNNGEDYDTKRSTISVTQPIFKSGGIYSAIKYANSYEKYSNTNIDTQKKELIKQVISLLYQIKQVDISINKQKLLIKNAKIDVQRKKEQVLNGITDSSFLDNAIIEANTRENTLVDLEYQKVELVNTLSTISDKKYEELELPIFAIIDNDKFIENNVYIKKASEDIDTSYWMKNMVISSYLPTVNFTADYTKYHDIDNNPTLSENGTKNVGFNITIPLDVRVSYDIQSNKIAYLQKKLAFEDKKKEEISLYKNSIAKIKSIEKKIDIAKNDVKLYDSLLTQLQEQLSVGMSTPSDVETMENSKKIKALDVKSLNIDIQIKLLDIYSRIES
jgi:outer membrane protein TolC